LEPPAANNPFMEPAITIKALRTKQCLMLVEEPVLAITINRLLVAVSILQETKLVISIAAIGVSAAVSSKRLPASSSLSSD